MKVCHSCGTKVDDKELICPVCKQTVVVTHGELSLKPVEEKKQKKTNPMGTHISSGSGLTDILRSDDSSMLDDGDLYGGSLPSSYARTEIDSFTEKKRKIHVGKYLFFAIIIIAICFFVFTLYKDYNEVKRGADSYEAVVKNYTDAYINKDEKLFDDMMPLYMDFDKNMVSDIYEQNITTKFISFNIEEVSHLDTGEIVVLQDDVKISTSKTVAIQEAVRTKVAFEAEVMKKSTGTYIKNVDEGIFVMIKVRDRWYLDPLSSSFPFVD